LFILPVMKKTGFIILFIYLLPLSLIVFAAVKLFYYNYDGFVSYVASSLHKPGWEKFIRSQFTENAFNISKWIIVFLAGCYLFAGFYLFRKKTSLIRKLDAGIISFSNKMKELKKEFSQMPAYSKWLLVVLFLFVIVKALWYIINWPLQYDEVWTYNYNIGNGFWQSFLLPQNHTFFTVVAWFFHLLPIDPQISMRLPNFFAGLVLLIIFFIFIKRYVSLKAALVSTFFLSTCCPVVFYMLYARGYLFVLLFTIIALWLQLILIREKQSNFYKLLLFTAIVLGYWSNPVFLYPHAAIASSVFIYCFSKKTLKIFWQNILVHTIAILAMVILYLPTLLSSHIDELIQAGVRDTFEPDMLWLSFIYNSWFIFGIRSGYVLLSLFLIFIAVELIQKNRFGFLHWFLISSFFIILIFSFLQSLPLAGHITIFLSISMAVLLAFVFKGIEMKIGINKIVFLLLLAGTIAFNTYMAHHHYWFNWSVEYDRSTKKVAAEMISKKIRNCYLSVNYYKPHLEYYYKIKGKELHIGMADTSSQDHHPFNPGLHESVILRNNKTSNLDLHQYQIFYQDETITAYIRTDVNR